MDKCTRLHVLLTEYDEAAHIANEKRWSYEDGLAEGEKSGIIIGSIKVCKDLGLTDQETRDKISAMNPVEPNLLDELMDRYWN